MLGGCLVGRDAECGRVAELLEGARSQQSGVLVLVGEPGIGKSALCGWAIARADGMRVLRVRGVESEVDLGFAGLSELSADQEENMHLSPKPHARALEGALARRATRVGNRFAIGAAPAPGGAPSGRTRTRPRPGGGLSSLARPACITRH
jgi:AAA ATPase domain